MTVFRTVELDGVLPSTGTARHRDALVAAGVPLGVRAVHDEGAAAEVPVAPRRQVRPVVSPQTFRLDACKDSCELRPRSSSGSS